MGGLCFVCLNRVEPGVIQHMDHGQVVLGEFQRWPEPRTHDIAALFRSAGVNCKVSDNLAQAHWEKLVWNIPFNGLGAAAAAGFEAMTRSAGESAQLPPVAPCLTTDRLLADPGWAKLVRELMIEVIRASEALGFNIPETLADKQIERTRTMGAYKPSTLLDYELGRPVELASLFLNPFSQARAAGVNTPRLEALCHVLQHLQPSRASNAARA